VDDRFRAVGAHVSIEEHRIDAWMGGPRRRRRRGGGDGAWREERQFGHLVPREWIFTVIEVGSDGPVTTAGAP
jgi:hypothetical protein